MRKVYGRKERIARTILLYSKNFLLKKKFTIAQKKTCAKVRPMASFPCREAQGQTRLTFQTRKTKMNIAEATTIVTRILGQQIRYATAQAAAQPHTDDYRNFTILAVEKIAKAVKTGKWYFVATVVDHDDGNVEKIRSLHIEGIM